MNIPTLDTSRLMLRAFSEDDAEPLHRILGEEGVLRYFPSPDPPSLDRVRKFIARQLAHWEEHGFGWWAVVPHGQKELIGWNGLQFLPETGEVEVGYLLSKPFWGRGLAVEGARPSLQFGFETLGLERIIALVHPENRASIRVIEKLEMSLVDRAEYFGIQVLRYALDRPAFAKTQEHGQRLVT
jgi:RimJ/RimL family protein N-acetyltransferase